MIKPRLATTQCKVCKRIQDEDEFRLPWPGELGHEIKEVYCPRCAKETLKAIQSGVYAQHAQRRRIRISRTHTV